MIAGIYQRKECYFDLEDLVKSISNSLNKFGRTDKVGSWFNGHVALVQTTLWNTPESKYDPTPFVDKNSKKIILFWGIITNREELAKRLGINDSFLKKMCDSEIICKSYIRWNKCLSEYIFGDFSFVIYDEINNSFLCSTDHMGTKPLYYYFDENILLFSSTISLFHHLKLFPMNPNMEWAAKYVLGISMDFEKTLYDNIFKLPPSSNLYIGTEYFYISKYFNFRQGHQLDVVNIDECLEQYLELLTQAVTSRITTSYNLGSETSGGIDSSTITSLAAKYYKKPVDNFYTFGIALLEKECDYILQTSQKYLLPNNYIHCGLLDYNINALNRAIEIMGCPPEISLSVSFSPFYEQCFKSNVRTLLSGFGGDEFVTSLHGDIVQRELFINNDYKNLINSLPGNKVTTFIRFIKLLYTLKVKKEHKYNPKFLKAFNSYWPYLPVRKELVEHYSLKKQFFDYAKFDAGHKDLNKFTLECRLKPHVPTRMNNCTHMALSYGVEYSWPLLDVRLIKYFLSVPTKFKYIKGINRYFHRKAVDQLVPKQVNWKIGKSMGNPVIGKEIYKMQALNNDLHPDLSHIIDINKLKKDIHSLENSQNLNLSHWYTCRKMISNTNLLDLWLKKFHPNGCNWKNTP
ncbi:MAG: hypothetical protein GY750_04955 [Lentisphaerae bacterium]|nr:hypothetical protein [Lentisphaerota bacterium]